MLCVNKYPQDYVDECRTRVKRQLAAYRGLIAVLKLKVGDPIALSEGDYSLLSTAFFDEIERRFA
jgi:hypothetical protein